MKYKLSETEEKVFWETVGRDLSDFFQINPDPYKWTAKDRKNIATAVNDKLVELNELHPEWNIPWLCNFNNDKHKKEDVDVFDNLYLLFVRPSLRTTREYTKHRFSFFLIERPADDYIERRQVKRLAAQAHELNKSEKTTSIEKEYNISSPAPAIYQQYIDDFKSNAESIRENLNEHYGNIEVKEFLDEFEKLHKKNIDALLKGNLNRSKKYILAIYELSEKAHFTAGENARQSIKSHLPSLDNPKYANSAERLGVLISLYLTGKTRLDKFFLNFYKRKNKTPIDWEEFYQRTEN